MRLLLGGRKDVKVVTFDLLTYAGSLENLRDLPDSARHVFVKGDICERAAVDAVLATHAIDTIVHFAAESHVDRSIAAPGEFIRTNVTGTFTLLEAVRALWGGRDDVRFHHVSTDEVYGSLGPDDPPVREDGVYAPRSPYAASKAASDHLVRAYATTYGLPEKLIPLMIVNGALGKPLPVYGDGKQVRDWLHVEDHCTAILAILERGRPGETYHIGGGNQPTNLEVVDALCQLLDVRYPDAAHAPHRSSPTASPPPSPGTRPAAPGSPPSATPTTTAAGSRSTTSGDSRRRGQGGAPTRGYP